MVILAPSLCASYALFLFWCRLSRSFHDPNNLASSVNTGGSSDYYLFLLRNQHSTLNRLYQLLLSRIPNMLSC